MEYSIQALARLTGVMARTLRWYDKIGLLKPCRRTDSGYRVYGPAEVDRLQDILYYRTLGIGLAQIRTCLDAPSFDRLAALRGHLTALEARQRQLQTLIGSLRETIQAQERNEIMSDEKKFEAFKQRVVDENEQQYGPELRAQYGDAEIDDANAQIMGLSAAQYDAWVQLGNALLSKLSDAVAAGEDPAGETGREITALHRHWLTATGNGYDVQRHRHLGEMYVQDPRFTAYYDKTRPGCAAFLRDAVLVWAK